jgi:hypothetical protein
LCLDANALRALGFDTFAVKPPLTSPNEIFLTLPVDGFLTYTTYFLPPPVFLLGFPL